FAGTGVVSGSIKSSYNVHANDIQAYSGILSSTYLTNLKGTIKPDRLGEIKKKAQKLVNEFLGKYPELNFDYDTASELSEFVELEEKQQALINFDFKIGFHL